MNDFFLSPGEQLADALLALGPAPATSQIAQLLEVWFGYAADQADLLPTAQA